MATSLRVHNHNEITQQNLKKVADDFFSDYELKLPKSPTLAILAKCKKYNIVRQSSGTFYLNHSEALKWDISKETEGNLQKQQKLFSDFFDFVKNGYENLKELITQDIAVNLLLSFIESNDTGLFFISNESSNGILPEPTLPHDKKRYLYIFNKYIAHLYKEKPDVFRIVVDIALGGIATNALLFPFSGITSDSVKGCTIFLDTALVLFLVGADEDYNAESVIFLLDAIKSNGGSVKIFSHTYDEAMEALNGSLKWIESPEFDPAKANRTTLYFRQEGYTRSQVQLIIASFDRRLLENGISTVDTPQHTIENTLVDENDLQKIFETEMERNRPWFHKEEYRKRTLRDIDSVSAVARLRGEKKYIKAIKDAKYIFVTTNEVLVRSNHIYRTKQTNNKDWIIDECVSDIFLGTYLWVNTPQIAEKTNALKLKAVAISAIKPDLEMEKELYLEAQRMLASKKITQDDYILVTNSHLVKDMLMDKHLGEVSAITESSIYAILEEAKSRMIGSAGIQLREMNQKYEEEKTERKKAEKDSAKKDVLISRITLTAQRTAKNRTRLCSVLLHIMQWIFIVVPTIPALTVSNWFFSLYGLIVAVYIVLLVKKVTVEFITEKIFKALFNREMKKLGLDSSIAIIDRE
jgi:hypothetical protein